MPPLAGSPRESWHQAAIGMKSGPIIQAARPQDVPALQALIRELADFERLTHVVTCTDADLQEGLFGPQAVAEALLLRPDASAEPVAFALFFHNFSTFLGRRGLYLEDLYVQ